MKSFTFLVLALLLLLGLPACSKKVAQQDGGNVDYYTCTIAEKLFKTWFGLAD